MDSIKPYLFADGNNSMVMEKLIRYHGGSNC